MTREELIVYDRWLTENKWGSSEIVTPEQAADIYLAKHPLHPAEGAEAILHGHIDKQSMDELSVNVWPDMLEAMTEFAAQPQPTAEGAEEILDAKEIYLDLCFKNIQFEDRLKLVVMAMEKYATLHAQRIAEKMVSENLVEFGNMIRDEPNGDIAALAEYFIRTINLKSRK